MSQENQATDFLRQMLGSGAFDAQHARHADLERTRPRSVFNIVRARDGRPAAERDLAETMTMKRMVDLSEALQPVANGILAISIAGRRREVLRVKQNDLLLTPLYEAGEDLGGVWMSVPNTRTDHPGSNIFGPRGNLGLIGVALHVARGGETGYPFAAELVLILRSRHRDHPSGAFTAVKINQAGNLKVENRYPAMGPDNFLLFSLGLLSPEHALSRGMNSGGDVSDSIGFPNAFTFIADNIHFLGPYLESVATQLDERAR